MDSISRTEIISAACMLLIATVMRADDRSLTLPPGVFQKARSEASYFHNPTQPSPFLLCNRPDRGIPRIALAFQHSETNRSADRKAPAVDEDVPIPLDAEGQTDTDGEVSGDMPPPDDAEEAQLTLFGIKWHEAGPVTAECLYTGEVFNNTRGGLTTKGATRYRGDLAVTLRLDTELADWWQGGEFFVYFQQNHGRTLTPHFVGDGQYYSSIDTGNDQDITQLAEYSYQHTFGEGLASVKVGRQDANENFAFADLGGDFINSSFVTLPNVPLPTWPYQTLGISSLWQPTSQLRLGGGVYDHGMDHGQWWMSAANRGVFVIGQADFQPFADDENAGLTLIRCGSWFTTSDTNAVDASAVFDGNFGFYTTLDQMLWTESGDNEQGMGAFLQFSWTPSDRNQVDLNYGAGLVYRGLLPDRDSDTLGAGFTVIEFSPTLREQNGQTSENAMELFYKARVRSWLTMQPDLQYIARPNGNGSDALVAGLRCEIAF